MSVNIETAIKYMYDLRARGIRYSMTGSRTGKDGTGDCSGTIYQGLRNGGATNAGWVLNTDSMHDWLVKNGFNLIAQNKEWTAKRGDIVIFGKKGQSGGAAGHVVIFISNTQIIHCTYKSAAANGVYVDNEATTCPYNMGWYVYRQKGSNTGSSSSTKSLKVGDRVKVVDALYVSSEGGGRSTAMRGKTGRIKRDVGRGKRYLVENWGWAHPNDIQLVESAKLTPKPQPVPNKGKWIAEKGKFYPNFALPLTVNASGNGALIANIFKNQYIEYDAFMIDDKYVWIRQPRGGGKYGYMATGNAKNGKRIDYWGTFK